MPDNNNIPPLPQGYEAVDTSEPPLPKGYFDIKKKIGGNGNGIDVSTQQNQNGTNGFQQLKNAVSQVNLPQTQNNNLGTDTGMQAPDTGAIKVQEQKTLKQAVTNTAHQFFNNNKPLLKQLSKTNENIIAKDKEGKDIEDEYNPDQLEKTAAFQNKVKEINQAVQNGNLTITHYQNGVNIGKPVLTKPEGFLGSLGGSIANSFNTTKDALVTMFKDNKGVADYYDQQRKNLPEIPESEPVGVGSMVGGMVGGMIKPVAEFAAGEAIAPEGGGLITAGADIIPTTTSEKTKEIYFDRMNALESQYGKGKVPEAERMDAIQKARAQAPLQALPSEAMQLYLFGKGAGTIEDAANKEAIQSFSNVLQKSGADIGKMAALGGTSELATQGIKQAQSGNGKFDENISEAAGQWAMMEAAFKAIPIVAKATGSVYSKFVNSSAKNVLATADPAIVQKLSEEAVQQGVLTPEQANVAVQDVNDFAKIKQTMPDGLSQTKQSSIGGFIQKNNALEAEKQTKNPVFHEDYNAEIAANEEKSKQILNSNQPLKYETDNLTGERAQDVGGRPTKDESPPQQKEDVTWDNLMQVGNTINYNGDKVKIEKIIDNGDNRALVYTDKGIIQVTDKNDSFLLYQNGKNETKTEKPIEKGTLGSTAVNEPKGIPTVEGGKTEENVGTTLQPKQEETKLEQGKGEIKPVKVGKVDVSEHGEDTNTKNNLENGTESTSLTNKGKQESKDLGQYIYDHDQYEIVTSDVDRAEKTANKAAEEVNRLRGIKKGTPMEEANGIKVETNPLLRTWDIGEYDGKQEGSFNEADWANNPDKAPKSGESFNDFKDRMGKAYDYVKTLPETTHVITHSKVMRAFEALNKTDGKWNDETTKEFLNNKEEPTGTAQPQQEKINDLEEQKYNKMKDDIKGETKLNLIPSKELVKAKEPIEAKKTHDAIKERYKTLKKLIDCI